MNLEDEIATRLWKLWAGGAACGCEFDPRHADDGHESVHFHRQCYHCGETWAGLHCPHDGYQNPCPKCGKRPDTINAQAMAREVIRQMEWARESMPPETARSVAVVHGLRPAITLAPEDWKP